MMAADCFQLELGIQPGVKVQIIQWLSGKDAEPEWNVSSGLRPFFQYCENQVFLALAGNGQLIPAKHLQDSLYNYHLSLLEIGQCFKESMPKDVIKQRLSSHSNKSVANSVDLPIDDFINLAVRVLLMLNVGELPNGISDPIPILWEDGTVQELVSNIFPAVSVLDHEGAQLGSMFIAHNLVRIAGIEIGWTSNLADHLRVIDDDKKVLIFHHASFLQCQHQ